IGTGELRRIASRVAWMRLPVDRSITVSAPHLVAQRSFATSSSTVDVTADVPMLAFTFTRNRLPMIIGSDSGWLTLTGSTARPAGRTARNGTRMSGRDPCTYTFMWPPLPDGNG